MALEPTAIDAALADEKMPLCAIAPQAREVGPAAGQRWWIEGRHSAESSGDDSLQETTLVRTLVAQLARLDAERRDICRILDGASRRRLDAVGTSASH